VSTRSAYLLAIKYNDLVAIRLIRWWLPNTVIWWPQDWNVGEELKNLVVQDKKSSSFYCAYIYLFQKFCLPLFGF
jgi:hypothetical protein